MPANRTFEVKALSRVEGEGALYVKLNGDQVEHVELNIYEPPRFFESFLRGRAIHEVPDITARICGICPVAYQMTACHALEKALRMKKIGNEILEVLGGRAIHPINVTVGGFYRAPNVEALKKLLPDLEWGLAAAMEMLELVSTFEFPDL